MPGLTGLSHAGFASSNLERTLDFYTNVLGAKVQWQTERQIKLYVGDLGLAIPLGTGDRSIASRSGWLLVGVKSLQSLSPRRAEPSRR